MSEEEDIGQLDITDEMIAEGRSYTGVMPDDMPKMMARTILGIDTAWMPYMYPIKFALFIGLVFLLIQGISEVLKCVYAVKNRRWP